jgi:hypothetical protein
MIGSADLRKISHLKKRVFLAAFSRSGSLSKAAERAKVDLQAHYIWLKEDAWYLQAYRQAVIEAADSLQEKLTEIAFGGNVKAAFLLLKELRAEQLRDRIEQANLAQTDWSKLTIAQLDIVMDYYLKRALGTDDPRVLKSAREQIESGKTVIDVDV